MPVPSPRGGESQDKFISRCMRFMHSEGGRPRKQQQAICFDKWRKRAKGVIDDMNFKRFIPISKVDEEKRMVYGYASTPDLDSQGEIVSIEGLKKALPDYLQFPAIREMHQAKAAGTTKEAVTSDKGLFIGAKIVADDAWNLVKEGVYRGFSLGGKIRAKIDNVIKELDLTEISLVDVPANRNTVFTLVKREGGELVDMQKDIYSAARLAEIAQTISFRIDQYIAEGKDPSDLEEALKRLKAVIVKEVKEKEDRTGPKEVAEATVKLEKAKMSYKEKQKLPKSSFAWVDSKGKGHLPIQDAAHVRNAMARFNQTHFDSPEAKRRAYGRILRAAKKFGIKVDTFKEKYGKGMIPQWVEEQNEMISKYTISSLRKEVIDEMAKAKDKKPLEELEEVTEETPQAPEEAPEVPAEEAGVEETAEVTEEPTEVPAESPEGVGETVIDETVQASENPDDLTKRLEKLEKTLTEEPKPTDEEVAMAKVVARFDTQIAKVTSIVERLAERLAKVESLAAPVKAQPSYLVEKGGKPEEGEDVEKKQARAKELENIRKTDLPRYQREGLQEEALALFDELRDLGIQV